MNFRKKIKYTFPSGKFYLNFRTVGLMGVPRSGKTVLGNLLATDRNAEYYEEPWLLGVLPAMVKLKMIDKEVGRDMYVSYLHELMNSMILLRQANFRPNDDSSIWTKKTRSDIFFRLKSLQSRLDVKNFVKKNKPYFLMPFSESSLFNLPAIFDFLPDCKIIHMVRRGIDVAYEFEKKRGFSNEQLVRPTHARIYYSVKCGGKNFYIPSWVDPKNIKKFIGYSEYERCLFYWCTLMEREIKSFDNLKSKKKNILIIKFEDFMENPRKIMHKANFFINAKPSSMTEVALRKIKSNRACKKAPKLPEELLIRTKKIYKYLKYDWN